MAITKACHCISKMCSSLPGTAGWSCPRQHNSELQDISYSVISTMVTFWPVSHSSVEQSESTRERLSILYAYKSKPGLTWHVTRHSSHLVPSAMQSSAVQKSLHYFARAHLSKDAESVCITMLHLCPDSQTSTRASQMGVLNWILCLVYLHRQLCARVKPTPISTGVLETMETTRARVMEIPTVHDIAMPLSAE